jgi:hypothetical protein
MIWIARGARQGSLAGLLLVVLAAAPAEAVIVATNNFDATLRAPGNDPGWSSLAFLKNASAVYLGNRWMITANHVGDGNVRFTDGRTFNFAIGSGRQLSNPAGTSGTPDLRMFRLVQDPGLPTMPIASSLPASGEQVLMVGAGRERGPGLLGWTFASGVWTPTALPLANQFGYMLESDSQMQWGTNQIEGGSTVSSSTRIFTTRFDRFALHFEAQAVTGDSGGGVFDFVNGHWELLGIMVSQQSAQNQPANTVIFSNTTQSADLSRYRDQIIDLLNRADPAWQNQVNLFDVNRSGAVGPLDALLLINELKTVGDHSLTGTPSPTDLLLDVNGDGSFSTIDAFGVINGLINGTANPSAAASSSGSAVPEPSSVVLAIIAILGVAACHALRRARVTRDEAGR